MMKEKKHAYLVITHQYTPILETLIKMIDEERNDIYVHIDKKVKTSFEDRISSLVKHSELYFVKRHKVYWGHVSQVKAECELFQTAYNHGGYSRYHLVSGADLPVRSQDFIHEFFDAHQDEEFISFTNNELLDRVIYKWLFTRHLRGLCSSRTWMGRKINRLQQMLTLSFLNLQKNLGLKNHAFDCYKKGSNWVSLTDRSVGVLLQSKKKALRAFRFANCPDEHYKQTILFDYNKTHSKTNGNTIRFYQYPKREEILHTHPNECLLDSARYIPWSKGRLNLTIKDYDEIVNSDAMFCRKVVDEELAKKIFERFGPKE